MPPGASPPTAADGRPGTGLRSPDGASVQPLGPGSGGTSQCLSQLLSQRPQTRTPGMLSLPEPSLDGRGRGECVCVSGGQSAAPPRSRVLGGGKERCYIPAQLLGKTTALPGGHLHSAGCKPAFYSFHSTFSYLQVYRNKNAYVCVCACIYLHMASLYMCIEPHIHTHMYTHVHVHKHR